MNLTISSMARKSALALLLGSVCGGSGAVTAKCGAVAQEIIGGIVGRLHGALCSKLRKRMAL